MLELYSQNSRLKLEILGYQFPGAREFYDANWLKIKLSASNDDYGHWEGEESCLLTTELVDLKRWFQELSIANPINNDIKFLEGELAFRVFDSNELSVSLFLNFNPVQPINPADYAEAYEMKFQLTNNTLQAVIASLDKSIEKFPVKQMWL